MTYGTLVGVVVWIALVAAPIFLPTATAPDDEQAIFILFAERASAYERGDEAALRATTTPDFRSVVVGGKDATEESAHEMGARPEFVQFVTHGVASVGAIWEVPRGGGGSSGAMLYILVKRGGRWLVSNVMTASAQG